MLYLNCNLSALHGFVIKKMRFVNLVKKKKNRFVNINRTAYFFITLSIITFYYKKDNKFFLVK